MFQTQSVEKIDPNLWVEKYRPQRLEDYIGNDHIKQKFSEYIENGKLENHILLYGKQGTGKSTAAKILVGNMDVDYLYINASDTNSVDDVRTTIKRYISTAGMGNQKIVILDEFDYMSTNAMAALRNMMERYSDTSKFILTANYRDAIIQPILSRVQDFGVSPPDNKTIAKHVRDILDQENVLYDEGLAYIIKKYSPDIRKIINEAQNLTQDGTLEVDVDSLISSSFNMELVELIKNSTGVEQGFKSIRTLCHKHGKNDFVETFRFIYDNVDELSNATNVPASMIILYVADGQFKSTQVVDKEINFVSTMTDILKLIHE